MDGRLANGGDDGCPIVAQQVTLRFLRHFGMAEAAFVDAHVDPAPLPPKPTCPNVKWTPVITDVAFTDATLTLLENGDVSDVIVVPVVVP